MKSTNASPMLFGVDFQVNAAIVLMLDHIETARQVRVEGEEDVEITLEGGGTLYAQAKSVVNPDDFSNVKAKLRDGVRTLSASASRGDCEGLIYITNSPNPFGVDHTMHAFTGMTNLNHKDLPQPCKDYLEQVLDQLATKGYDLSRFDRQRFWVRVLPFRTDDPDERHKMVKQKVDEFLASIDSVTPGLGREIMGIWQRELFENATKQNKAVTVRKSEFIWPIVVLEMRGMTGREFLDDLDDVDWDELMRKYATLIDNKIERFEFSTKVIYDYDRFHDGSKGNERMLRFIRAHWQDYVGEFDETSFPPGILEKLIQLILYKLIRRKYVVMSLRGRVKL